MKRMTRSSGALVLALALMQPALAQGEAGATSRIDVTLGDVSQMRELKHLHGAPRRTTTLAIQSLADWLQRQAESNLPAEQSLHVTLRDVDLAGEYEPGVTNMHDIRVVKNLYPPRIALDYRLSDAAGNVLREGDVTLRDIGFMQGTAFPDSDSLRYEKRMLRNWLRSLH